MLVLTVGKIAFNFDVVVCIKNGEVATYLRNLNNIYK